MMDIVKMQQVLMVQILNIVINIVMKVVIHNVLDIVHISGIMCMKKLE